MIKDDDNITSIDQLDVLWGFDVTVLQNEKNRLPTLWG